MSRPRVRQDVWPRPAPEDRRRDLRGRRARPEHRSGHVTLFPDATDAGGAPPSPPPPSVPEARGSGVGRPPDRIRARPCRRARLRAAADELAGDQPHSVPLLACARLRAHAHPPRPPPAGRLADVPRVPLLSGSRLVARECVGRRGRRAAAAAAGGARGRGGGGAGRAALPARGAARVARRPRQARDDRRRAAGAADAGRRRDPRRDALGAVGTSSSGGRWPRAARRSSSRAGSAGLHGAARARSRSSPPISRGASTAASWCTTWRSRARGASTPAARSPLRVNPALVETDSCRRHRRRDRAARRPGGVARRGRGRGGARRRCGLAARGGRLAGVAPRDRARTGAGAARAGARRLARAGTTRSLAGALGGYPYDARGGGRGSRARRCAPRRGGSPRRSAGRA